MATTATDTQKSGQLVSGLILLHKPVGQSSFYSLGRVKKVLGTRKVGHAGTLDPFAEGLLVVLVGKMTKAASLFSNLDKEYLGKFRFGEETDTLDTEGRVTETAPVPEYSAIQSASDAFMGEITQTAPAYSAIKIDGKRAYSRARAGESFHIPSRTVYIREFELLEWATPDLDVRISCSKGTYIRSIARDLGLASGSRAHCRSLTRTKIGSFTLNDACRPDDLTREQLIDPVDALRGLGIPVKTIDDDTAGKMRFGVPFSRFDSLPSVPDEFSLFIDSRGEAAALVERREGQLRYSIVFDSP